MDLGKKESQIAIIRRRELVKNEDADGTGPADAVVQGPATVLDPDGGLDDQREWVIRAR